MLVWSYLLFIKKKKNSQNKEKQAILIKT